MQNTKIVKFFYKLNFFLIVTFFFLTIVIINFLLIKIFPENALSIPDKLINISHSWFGKVFMVIIGPAFETLFFQMIPILATRELVSKDNNVFIISTLVSSLTFALAHGIYGRYYMLYAFVGGVLLAILYNVSIYRKDPPFLPVFIIHALWNLVVLLLIETNFFNNII